jgi:hypothetical protein
MTAAGSKHSRNSQDVFDMDQNLAVAKRLFPARHAAIDELAVRDEEFYLLCVDLSDAEEALGRWQESENPLREMRCAEYGALVGDLAAEVGAALDGMSVIPLHRRRSRYAR